MSSHSGYTPPLVLTVLSAVFIGTFTLCAIWIAFDIIRRQGWKSMMAVMIPVYILNALYLAPLTLWTYLNFGRPSKPNKDSVLTRSHCMHHSGQDHGGNAGAHSKAEKEKDDVESGANAVAATQTSSDATPHDDHHHTQHRHHQPENGGSKQKALDRKAESNDAHQGDEMSGPDHHHVSADRPMFATVMVGVCHCGAGCLLGDIVGEWLVYGTGARIRGRMLWAEFLIDFAFALLFGIVFQYYSIAPMSGDYGPKSIYRAAKADILSLTSFELGLFGWMAIFQIVIFDWDIEMNTITYWWMMQIGMFLGHWTAVPVNWWLINAKIKEPCA